MNISPVNPKTSHLREILVSCWESRASMGAPKMWDGSRLYYRLSSPFHSGPVGIQGVTARAWLLSPSPTIHHRHHGANVSSASYTHLVEPGGPCGSCKSNRPLLQIQRGKATCPEAHSWLVKAETLLNQPEPQKHL